MLGPLELLFQRLAMNGMGDDDMTMPREQHPRQFMDMQNMFQPPPPARPPMPMRPPMQEGPAPPTGPLTKMFGGPRG
jgi:hypothetical protein